MIDSKSRYDESSDEECANLTDRKTKQNNESKVINSRENDDKYNFFSVNFDASESLRNSLIEPPVPAICSLNNLGKAEFLLPFKVQEIIKKEEEKEGKKQNALMNIGNQVRGTENNVINNDVSKGNKKGEEEKFSCSEEEQEGCKKKEENFYGGEIGKKMQIKRNKELRNIIRSEIKEAKKKANRAEEILDIRFKRCANSKNSIRKVLSVWCNEKRRVAVKIKNSVIKNMQKKTQKINNNEISKIIGVVEWFDSRFNLLLKSVHASNLGTVENSSAARSATILIRGQHILSISEATE